MDDEKIKLLFIAATAIFTIAPVFILLYIMVYNSRKKKHAEEKLQMEISFESVLVKSQMEIREQTMQTIGAELHDNIGQLLSLTSLTLGSIEIEGNEKSKSKIDSAIELTNESIKELRQLGKLMQGEQLIGHGLKRAVQHEIDWIQKSGRYQVFFFYSDNLDTVSNKNTDLVIFRIVQEALNNILKHSGADKIAIEFSYRDTQIFFKIADNGKGFMTDGTADHGMGLFNIRKRVATLGGDLQIQSALNAGTTIQALIPYT